MKNFGRDFVKKKKKVLISPISRDFWDTLYLRTLEKNTKLSQMHYLSTLQ